MQLLLLHADDSPRRQWSSEVKGMGAQQQVGVVTLATAGLQQQLGQGLGAALDALMKHLCREACQRCQAALDSCHTLTKYLCILSHLSPLATGKDRKSQCLQYLSS